MASVALDRVVLSLASDPSQAVAAFSSDRSEQLAVPGEVRRMANGRLRTVKRKGTVTSLGATLRNLTPAQVKTLKGWAGETVLFRDVWGRKLYCVYFTPTTKDYTDRSGQDVTLSLSEVTFSEAVA